MRRILLISLVAFLLPAAAQGKTIEEKQLTATSTVQRWESPERQGIVAVHIFLSGSREFGKPVEIPQRLWHSCGANYQARGLLVVLRAKKCGQPVPGAYVFRYVSLRGSLDFRIRLSRPEN